MYLTYIYRVCNVYETWLIAEEYRENRERTEDREDREDREKQEGGNRKE